MSGNRDGITKLSQAEEQRLGVPGNTKFWSAAPFGSMNQSDARTALEDNEAYWLENFLLTGKGSLRTLYDKGPALYSATGGKTIIYFSFFNINNMTNCAVFLSDGTAYDVSFPSGVVTTISAAAGTFYDGGQLPVCCQSGSQYLLISNNISQNNYWIWDGTLLYSAGSLGPYVIGDITAGGSGYTSAPTVTFYGGAGTGATATATIQDGSVVALTITNAGTGYNPDDVVEAAFSGGGTDNGAVLQAVLTTSGVEAAVIDAGGSGYTSAPTVVFSAPDSGVTAGGIAALTMDAVSSITVNVPGTGYTSPPTITLTGGGGTGAAASAVLAISGISDIQVVSGGSGYTSAPTVTISGGGGTGAHAVAVLTGTVVTTITVTAPGAGYSSTPSVSMSGGGGTDASAVAVLTVASVTSVNVINGGSGFTGTPGITFAGGGGTGAAGTAVVIGGAISSITMTQAGSGYTSPPTVQVSGGLNMAAVASISIMPFGVSGTSIETFQSRVWISNPAGFGPIYNGGVFNVSAPSSLTNFATSAGGLLYTSSDRFLRQQYVAVHQLNGFFYTLADSSSDVISNVQTAGTPTATTFNYQNINAQIGCTWRDSVQDYGQSVLFANGNGICGLYAGTVKKVSKKMDNLFDNFVAPAAGGVTPSAAVASLYTIPVYLLNITIIDPLSGSPRTVLIGWDEANWLICSQTSEFTFVATQEISSVMTAWGTDGTGLYPLFQTPSAALAATIATKMIGSDRSYIVKEPMTVYVRSTDKSADQSGIELAITAEAEGIAQQAGLEPQNLPHQAYPLPVQPAYAAPNYTAPLWGGPMPGVAGTAIGVTIKSYSKDFVLSEISLSYRDVASVWG